MNRYQIHAALGSLALLVSVCSICRCQPADLTPASQPAQEANFLAMGDWGEGKPAQQKVADAMAQYVAREGKTFEALLSAGDNFYVPLTGTEDPTWQTLFEKMYDVKSLPFPFYISLGNHDYDQSKWRIELAYGKAHPDSRWKMPARWYRIDLPELKPLVTVIMLDSDHDFLTPAEWGEEREFLSNELARPRATWTICCAHHPLVSNGIASDNGTLQHDWGTLFQKFNVDIYLCGHEHNLQHLEVPQWKTSFVLAGGGGAHAHPMIRDNRGPYSRSVYGFVHFDFTPTKVTVRYLDSASHPLHEFVRDKAGNVTVTFTTPSDKAIPKPLAAILGFDPNRKPQSRPATSRSTTRPSDTK